MKTFTTVREDGTPGPDIEAENISLAEDKLKGLDSKIRHRVVGEKIKFYDKKDC
jgi:hypothetical protein|tara:strand:+ start:234 stop:395 length:162 start_codon:yes stop_codon:yes gene_type:complete